MAGERRNEEAKKKKEWNDGDATLHSMPASRILPQLSAHLGFQHRFYDGFDRRCGCPFGLLVDFFQDGLAFVLFQFPLLKVYSHSADPSWWLSLVFVFTLPRRGPQLLFSAAFPPFFLPLERDTLPSSKGLTGKEKHGLLTKSIGKGRTYATIILATCCRAISSRTGDHQAMRRAKLF